MKRTFKLAIAITIYAISICIGCWVGGTAMKDEWDNLMNWANGNKEDRK